MEDFIKDIFPFGYDENLLCHYTNFDKLCSILSTMTLRISSYEQSNDIGELCNNILQIEKGLKFRNNNITSHIKEKCGYISFSKTTYDDENGLSVGYLIPSMWGLYADEYKGACLVIDKDKLIEENTQLLERLFYKFLDVNYVVDQSLQIQANKNWEQIIKEEYQYILGTKHQSWSYEQECRLVGMNLPSSLSLKNGVIKGVVMGSRTTDLNKRQLLNILEDTNLPCYEQISKKCFVQVTQFSKRLFTTELGTYF